MKKIIISTLIVLGIIFTGYGLYINIIGSGANSDAGGISNDKWSFSGNFSSITPSGNGGSYAKIIGEIKSDLYGTFQFGTGASTTPIEFRTSTNTTLCGAGNTVYKIVGDIESYNLAWPTMSFTGNSYYCPSTNSWSGTVYSKLLGYKYMGNINTLVSPGGGGGGGGGTGIGAIFNRDSFVVQGIIGKGKNNINIVNAINTANNNSQQSLFVDVGVDKSQLNALINKNIAVLTKSLTPDITNIPITTLLNNTSLYYYNFEGSPAASISNENNKGKILKIGNTNYKVGVSGNKTVIVKGGNIYINADIYNTNDSNSLLVLIAKRDSTNNKNGGNIYINPNVTNIDAVLIADGSIINYDGSNVVTNSGSLMKQLLIYGSLLTKNSIGSLENPYGSDGYIRYGKGSTTGYIKYDLTKLRHFSLILSSTTDSVCSSPNNYLVPRKFPSSTGALEYAWAGKRQCYNEPLRTKQDSVQNSLRGTDKFNAVIVRYNPFISTTPPKILRK